MKNLGVGALLVLVACGLETTSFRTTDASDPARPGAALHVVGSGVRVDVWSNGGYIGSSDEPMTHFGFEVHNATAAPVIFDSSALVLRVFDRRGAVLAPARFVAVTPLGPARIAISPGETKTFEAYFLIPAKPRTIETMSVRWVVQTGDRRYQETSSFVRDDEFPITEPPSSPST